MYETIIVFRIKESTRAYQRDALLTIAQTLAQPLTKGLFIHYFNKLN